MSTTSFTIDVKLQEYEKFYGDGGTFDWIPARVEVAGVVVWQGQVAYQNGHRAEAERAAIKAWTGKR